MKQIEEIASLFLKDAILKSSTETLKDYDALFESTTLLFPQQIILDTAIKGLISGCSCKLYITVGQSEALNYSESDYDNFIADLRINYSGLDQGEVIILKVAIAKANDCFIPIICPHSLSNYFDHFNLEGLLELFNSHIQTYGKIAFLNPDIKEIIQSEAIFFLAPTNKEALSNISVEVNGRREKIQTSSFSSIFSRFQLLPEHFFLSEHKIFPFFDDLLKRLGLILAISSIFDITDISENEFSYKLNGYKTITGVIDFDSLTEIGDLDKYMRVYEWIYSSGAMVDKLGLSRNIISLHLKNAKEFILDGDIYQSILSAYKIYEKQNIKQYIEVRNKMSDQLIDYSKRANTIVESFASGFQKSSFAVITLYSSLIALRVLGTQTITNDFLNYSTLIGVIFLLVSFVYMLIAHWEVRQQRARFKSSYSDFKLRYTDLLTTDDINKILNNDKEHISDVQFISSKLKFYTLFWVFVILALLAFTLTYYVSEETTTIARHLISLMAWISLSFYPSRAILQLLNS